VEDYAFDGCANLTSVTIPSSVTSIGMQAFQNCTGLTAISIPANVTSIGDDAFFGCTSLVSATFAGNAPTMGSSVFENYTGSFFVIYTQEATGFTSPQWTDSAGDTFEAAADDMSQSITFPAIATQVYPSSPLHLMATSSSGLPVTFTVLSGPATLPQNSNVLTFTGTGTVVVEADQAGNNAYVVAASVTQSFRAAQSQPPGTWAAIHSITNLNATPENDGVPNLLKYLYDINPTTTMSATDRAALPVLGIEPTATPDTSYLTVTYRQNALATGITVNLQASTDLQTWTTVTPDVDQQTGVDPSTGDPIVEMGVSVLNAVPKKFIRLQTAVDQGP
jgi:hypothetical protein